MLVVGAIDDYVESRLLYIPTASADPTGQVWRNSVRHNLSVQRCFQKVLRGPGDLIPADMPTAEHSHLSSFWILDESKPMPKAVVNMLQYLKVNLAESNTNSYLNVRKLVCRLRFCSREFVLISIILIALVLTWP